ncbi:MAG: HAD hydrolase family protein [Acetobacteraceae bacterium]
MKRLVIFDLDGTLAQSKAALDAEMAALLTRLLEVVRVAVISGGAWTQFETQVLAHLPRDERLDKLSLLPTCGTKFYCFSGSWRALYSEDFSHGDRDKIIGGKAPLDAKKQWDPDFGKRKKIAALLKPLIPGFSIQLGGATSIDVTRPGIDKAYGVGKLRETLGIPIRDMMFIGDAIFPGGNDYPAKQAGVLSIEVRDPCETKRIIETIIACQE